MPLRVIGTGFGRTGTDSMREALNMLGFGPCHHMRALVQNVERKMLWRQHVAGARVPWETLFDGFEACIDWPSAYYWPELIKAYPDAKVLLTWRTPESWWESFSRTIKKVIEEDTETDETSPGSQLVANDVFGGHPLTREHCIGAYEANVARVLAEVPTGRLLVHRLGDGWKPLCDHLGVAVPGRAYPRRNSVAEFHEDLR